MKQQTDIIGVMSGTSLDGLDLAYTRFNYNEDSYEFEIIKAVTIKYPQQLKTALGHCRSLINNDLVQLHLDWAKFTGQQIQSHFLNKNLKPDFISSHGHTVFHEPKKGITLQIGSLPQLQKETNCDVIGDFRSLDVFKGGEGAPLVPIGDYYLFPEHQYCLNLGGIANVSLQNGEAVKAFDVCPCNIILNQLSSELGMEYDEGGAEAKKGKVNQELLKELNENEYYNETTRPSLGIEYIESSFMPLISSYDISVQDKLNTVSVHIAQQIKLALQDQVASLLVTGGGAYNTFLLECFNSLGLQSVVPSSEIVEFKEAVVFAFIGLRKIEGKVNVLKSVTGATSDSVAGCLFSNLLPEQVQ